MNNAKRTPTGTTETEQLAAFKHALMNGTPVSSGKARSAAAAQEARSAGAEPVQTNANKVNPHEASLTGENPGNTREKGSEMTPEELHEERVERAELRRTTRIYSGIPRIQKCCHTVRREAGVGVVKDYDSGVVSGYRGLYTCGSVWGCDRCAQLIQRERFLEVKKAMDQWLTEGATIPTQHRDYGPEGEDGIGLPWVNDPALGSFEEGNQIQGPAGYIDGKTGGIVWPGVNDMIVDELTGEITPRPLRRFTLVDTDVKHPPGGLAFMTLTMGHEAATAQGTKWAADPIWSAENAAFKVFTNGKFFKGNIHAYQRSVEVQWSARAGWHIHIHVALFVSKSFRTRIRKHGDTLFKAWASAVSLQGYQAKKAGFDLRMSNDTEQSARKLAQYVTKGNSGKGLAAEMTLNGDKKSVYSVSPGQLRQLLHANRLGRTTEDITEHMRVAVGRTAKPQARLLSIYQEFEKASRGKRWMTWSRGAKAAFAIESITDEQATAASENEIDGDALPDNLGSGELGGFKREDWRGFAHDIVKPVTLRGIVDSETTKPAAVRAMKKWAKANHAPIVVGEAWEKHLEESSAKADRKAAAKAEKRAMRKWSSFMHTDDGEVDPYEGIRGTGKWSLTDPGAMNEQKAAWWEEEFSAGADTAVLWDDEGEEPAEYSGEAA